MIYLLAIGVVLFAGGAAFCYETVRKMHDAQYRFKVENGLYTRAWVQYWTWTLVLVIWALFHAQIVDILRWIFNTH